MADERALGEEVPIKGFCDRRRADLGGSCGGCFLREANIARVRRRRSVRVND